MVEAAAQHRPSATMRQKVSLDPKSTDVQIFQNLDLRDVWADADLVSVYKYLRQGVSVPDTWHEAMAQLDAELTAKGLM